jgi:hypothetical protein
MKEKGRFSYKNGKVTYYTQSVKYEVVQDEFDMFSTADINQLEQDLTNDSLIFETRVISPTLWMTYDPKTQKVSTCKKR